MRHKYQEELFKLSGKQTSNDKLVCFLYLLMRDEIPTGKVSKILFGLEDLSVNDNDYCEFTNGYLADFAKFVAAKLKE